MTVGTYMSPNFTNACVVGAVMHRTGRVLAIQIGGDRRWQPPGGQLANEESAAAGVRRHVRCTTGFEITEPDLVDDGEVDGMIVLTFRCGIRGVGSDIAADTHAMRWLARADVRALPQAVWTRGLLRAFDLAEDASVANGSLLPEVSLAG